jgi:hypothetical protein
LSNSSRVFIMLFFFFILTTSVFSPTSQIALLYGYFLAIVP